MAPTFSPTIAPSLAPSNSPTACVDYYESYNSTDAIDRIFSVNYKERVNYSNSNMTVDWYIASEDFNFFAEVVSCNDTTADVCFIGCYYSGACADMLVKPLRTGDSNMYELALICSSRKACKDMVMNISQSHITQVNIFCIGTFSCSGGII